MILVILAKLFDNWKNWHLCNHTSCMSMILKWITEAVIHRKIYIFFHSHYSTYVCQCIWTIREPLNRVERKPYHFSYTYYIAGSLCVLAMEWYSKESSHNKKKRISLAYTVHTTICQQQYNWSRFSYKTARDLSHVYVL